MNLEEKKFELEQLRYENEKKFFNRNVGILISSIVSVTAILVSFIQFKIAETNNWETHDFSDEEKKQFVPDTTLGEKFTGDCSDSKESESSSSEDNSHNSQGVLRLLEDRSSRIWFASNGWIHIALPKPGYEYDITQVPFLRISIDQVSQFFEDQRWIWIVTSHNKLIRCPTTFQKDYCQPFGALVRKVATQEGDCIYTGSKSQDTTIIKPKVLAFKDHNLQFEVAAPYFEDHAKTLYQYYMEGMDQDWSKWSDSNKKEYNNLGQGKYTFHVRAKNVFNTESEEDTFSFRVLPPWYQTWWAYTFYIMAAIGFIMLIVRWRSYKLVQEKQQLEGIVAQRTQEVNSKNLQLQEKTLLLDDQSEKLKEMDQIKSRFFANISHEFRTPLSLIMGPLDNLRSGIDPSQVKQIDMAYRNAQRLLGLINQLLDLSKFESGKMRLHIEQGDLVLFFKILLEPFIDAADRYELNIGFHTNEDSIPLYFDADKLQKIVGNLLANAIKFTPQGGQISVTLKSEANDTGAQCDTGEGNDTAGSHQVVQTVKVYPQGKVTIIIKDTGMGIPSGQLPHIFDRFYQADSAHERRRKGSGIGLALVKELVELHQGEISVESIEGQGSEFKVILPLGNSHLTAADMAPQPGDRQDFQDEKADAAASLAALEPLEGEQDVEVNNGNFADEASAAQEKSLKNIVLVVEDSADLRTYIRQALEPEYEVVEASNGKQGVDKAGVIIPDLIISDIMMPEMDGYELCRTIKSTLSTSHIPVVLLTAKTSDESILHGLELGADDYVTKPFNTRLLCARIKNLIELRRRMQLDIHREMTLQPGQLNMSKMDSEFLNDLQQVIEKNLSDPDFNVEAMSRRLYISRTTLYRKVQALCGESPTDFIRIYRLKRAAQLLKNRFGSVTEVAFEVGFSSRAYFTKCFKDQFQRLPSDYLDAEN